MFRKLLDEGRAGENVGVLLRGTKREEVERGQVLAKPGSITPHTKFEAEVYVLSKEEGGRHTPFFKGYRPQFYFRTTDTLTSLLKYIVLLKYLMVVSVYSVVLVVLSLSQKLTGVMLTNLKLLVLSS